MKGRVRFAARAWREVSQGSACPKEAIRAKFSRRAFRPSSFRLVCLRGCGGDGEVIAVPRRAPSRARRRFGGGLEVQGSGWWSEGTGDQALWGEFRRGYNSDISVGSMRSSMSMALADPRRTRARACRAKAAAQAAQEEGVAQWHLAGVGSLSTAKGRAHGARGHMNMNATSSLSDYWRPPRIKHASSRLSQPRARSRSVLGLDTAPGQALRAAPIRARPNRHDLAAHSPRVCTQSSVDQIRREAVREHVADVLRARVLAVQRGNQLRGLAAHVLHHVHAALGEDGRLAGREGLLDQSRSVLFEHVCRCGSVDGNHEVRGPGMVVRREHGTRTKVQHRH